MVWGTIRADLPADDSDHKILSVLWFSLSLKLTRFLIHDKNGCFNTLISSWFFIMQSNQRLLDEDCFINNSQYFLRNRIICRRCKILNEIPWSVYVSSFCAMQLVIKTASMQTELQFGKWCKSALVTIFWISMGKISFWIWIIISNQFILIETFSTDNVHLNIHSIPCI